uniref:Integrase, catalytic region, zinc finger, CCHC-type, peptidase aspartic, catalytic n=1 Tax=Tanacetum cinerariifolium TaxID=118510 RepID=A0A699JHQ1_TANCI|nr:hypothetical protein [Tanacetum cinerariifolium]
MNYLEEQTDGEAMINSIQNGDQPLPVIAQVSLAENAQNAPPTLKDLKFWTAEEKKTRKIDRLARSLLIQGLPNDIYSLIYSNKTAKDLWDALERKKAVMVTSDPLALVAEKTNVSKRKEKVVVSSDSEGSGADDFSELKKITALLAKAFNRRKFYSKPTNNNLRTSSTSHNFDYEINANMVFMAQIEKVLSESDESSSTAEETIARYSALFDNDKQHKKQIADQEVLFDKMSVELVELDKHDLEIEKCLERLNVCENKLHKMGQTNQTVHMIMPSKDTLYNGRKGIGFENPSYFEKAKDLRSTLYDEKVIGLGYTLMFLTHSNESLEIKKFKRSRENKIEFAYDYGNLNASYVNEKINFEDDYFQEIINPDFDKIDSPF